MKFLLDCLEGSASKPPELNALGRKMKLCKIEVGDRPLTEPPLHFSALHRRSGLLSSITLSSLQETLLSNQREMRNNNRHNRDNSCLEKVIKCIL